MSNDWPMVKLSEVISLDLDKVAVKPATQYEMVGVYSFGRGLFRKEPVSGENTSYKTFYRLHSDHIVMSQLFGWEGALALSSQEFEGLFVSSMFPTFRCIDSRLDRMFLRWLMQRPVFWQDLGTRAKGMGDRRRTLNPDSLLETFIPLPPLAEQKRIVGRIEELAGKIEEARALREGVAKDIEALTISLHLDLAANHRVYLSDIIELYEEQTTIEPGNSYPQVGVRGFGQGLFPKEAVVAGETTYRYFNYLYQGAIVLSQVKGWEGAIGVCPAELEGWFSSPEYRTFRCLAGEANPEYLSYIFKSHWFLPFLQKATRGVGARRERTRPEQFLNIQIPMPPFDKQVKAVSILKRCEETHRIGTEMCNELDSLMPAVLDRAFRGQL